VARRLLVSGRVSPDRHWRPAMSDPLDLSAAPPRRLPRRVWLAAAAGVAAAVVAAGLVYLLLAVLA